MKSLSVLGIPHYNRPDLTARCIESIDYPVDKLVIIRNGPLDMFPMQHVAMILTRTEVGSHYITRVGGIIKSLVLVEHPNAGVAGAWNEIIKLFPAPWWLISNNDIAFAPGDLAKMVDFVERIKTCRASGPEPESWPDMIYGNHGASWFAITAHGIVTAGLFDENIFPAYLEDCDMSRRFDLLGLHRCNVPDVHAVHGDAERNITGSSTIHSDSALRECNARTHGGNFDYYRAKWGGINEREKFTTPFNDPNWPVWAWRFDPARRAEQQWPA